MDNKTLAWLFAGIALLCATALGVSIVVAGGDEGAPAPVVTSESPTPSASPTVDPDQFVLDIMEDAWNKQSYTDQKNLCVLFNYAPDRAWSAFDDGSEHLVSRELFDEFFGGKCATIT